MAFPRKFLLLRQSVSRLENSLVIFTTKFYRILLHRDYGWCLKINLKSSYIYIVQESRAILSSSVCILQMKKNMSISQEDGSEIDFRAHGHRRLSIRGRCKWGSCLPNIVHARTAFYNRHLGRRVSRFALRLQRIATALQTFFAKMGCLAGRRNCEISDDHWPGRVHQLASESARASGFA